MNLDYTHDLQICLDTLKKGGVILYPTDTIWGIGCDATNEKAVDRIYQIKKRNESKSLIILVPDESYIQYYCNDKTDSIFDFLKNVQKPTTIIFKNANNLPKNLINSDGSIGIRIVKDEFCKKLIKNFGKPIVSTSANISGSSSPQLFTDITAEIKNEVDYIVEYRQEETIISEASSIIGFNQDGSINLIRK